IFWNEILAPDEISRLLDPKVFTNAKRIDKNGEHKLDNFKTDENGDIKDNLIIKGNNLLAIHSLKKRFAGKVKLIYIDPPYYFHENKSEDTFNYNTNFKLSSWCVFMKNRLEVAKDLLSKDGAIFIQIDDDGLPYLKVILDELFGIENCITTIAVKVTSESGVKVSANKPVRVKETILCYFKSSDWKYNRQFVIDGTYDPNYSYFVENPDQEPSRWKIVNIKDKFLKITKNKKISEEDLYNFQIKYKNNIFSVRDISKELKEKYFSTNKNRFVVLKKENKPTILWKNGEVIFFSNKVRTINNKEFSVKYLSDIWIDISWDGIAKEGGVTLKRGKKPERLLERIIDMSTNRGDVVMDFFMGTGTTCAVAHKMGRQYIGVEQLDYGENSAVVRLKNVINGDQTGISKQVGWKGGGDFVYLELAKWNENFVEKIQKAKTKEELKQLWKIMKEKAFLSYKVDVKAIDENAKDFEELSIENQRRFLLECLDKNHLYVNYSEIDDEEYRISEEDKKLNKEFYEK
ncbi:MAG TPA: site-specific DNA-methyltransferase, partial [Candidatus Pacearchaeota archaeon]|nr:site-specific DNA-methyltransferase [Candidatus Pacearchaeota archaeon]